MLYTRRPPPLPHRANDAHKGDCGRILIVGGSRGMAGAPCLAARAAFRGGAGLVKVAVPESIWDVVAVKLDECTTAGLPATRAGALSNKALVPLLAIAQESSVVVLGPGLSLATEALAVARAAAVRIQTPLLLDADGLNAFAGGKLSMLGRARAKSVAPMVLTPHPGEMARLLNTSVERVQKDRPRAARRCQALIHRSVVVLKGAGTVVTDGRRTYINKTGNPGMASGGTGDVLAGLIAALLGQHMGAYEAACLGVYLHGQAGDLAAQRLGEWSLMAGDLIDNLPNAFLARDLKNGNRSDSGTT